MNNAPSPNLSARISLSTRLTLCVIPLMTVAFVLWIERAKGPFWLGSNSDPDYAYLLNALALAIAKMPAHTDHPGTTLQAFGAVVLRATHLFFGRANIVDDVLLRPEFYLRAINFAVLALFAIIQTAVGWTARRLSYNRYDIVACLLLQAAPLAAFTSVQTLACVNAEGLLQAVATVLTLVIVCALAKNTTESRGTAWSMGAIVAAGVVTKVTFVPMLLILFCVLSGWRARLHGLGAFVATVLILLLPVYKLVPRIGGWLWDIATHTGTYGAGATGFADPAIYMKSLWELIGQEWIAALIIAASFAVGFAYFFVKEKEDNARREAAVLWIVSLAQIAQFLVVAKHPARHYLQPALSLLGLNLFLIYRISLQHLPLNRSRPIAICTVAALSFIEFRNTAEYSKELQAMKLAQFKTVEFQQRQPNAKVIYHYRSSSLESALAFGNGYAGGRFGHDLHRLYPRALFYSLWHKTYYNFDADFPLESILKWAESEPVFLQGTPFDGDHAQYTPANVKLERVSEPGPEVLYRVTPAR